MSERKKSKTDGDTEPPSSPSFPAPNSPTSSLFSPLKKKKRSREVDEMMDFKTKAQFEVGGYAFSSFNDELFKVRIIDIDPNSDSPYKVHYIGWNAKFDEYVGEDNLFLSENEYEKNKKREEIKEKKEKKGNKKLKLTAEDENEGDSDLDFLSSSSSATTSFSSSSATTSFSSSPFTATKFELPPTVHTIRLANSNGRWEISIESGTSEGGGEGKEESLALPVSTSLTSSSTSPSPSPSVFSFSPPSSAQSITNFNFYLNPGNK